MTPRLRSDPVTRELAPRFRSQPFSPIFLFPRCLSPCPYVPACLTHRWEILWFYALLFGQFHGFTHQLNGQFQGIPLEKSQPSERTFGGVRSTSWANISRAQCTIQTNISSDSAPLKRTPHPKHKNAGFRHAVRSVKRSVALVQDGIQFWWRVRTDNCLSVP